MNLYHQPAINLQFMPPHWRNNGFYVAVLNVLTTPLTSFYVAFNSYVREVKKEINITPQVGVLEHYICRKMGLGNRDVFFSDVQMQGVASVYLNVKYQSKEYILRQVLKQYLPVGCIYNIVYF